MKVVAGTVLAGWATLGLTSCGESHACLAQPCPMPVAVELSITSRGGGPVSGAAIQVTGPTTTTLTCNGGAAGNTCGVPGLAGTYQLEVTAAGYEPTRRSVAVAGTTPECSCPQVQTAHVDLVLTRSAPAGG